MKLEEIQSLWAGQPSPEIQLVPPDVRNQLERELRRRRRNLAFGTIGMVLSVILVQALFIINAVYRGGMPSPIRWISLGLSQALGLTILFFIVRALLRNRRISRRQGESLHAVFQTKLEMIQENIADYRGANWFLIVGAFTAALSAYSNFPYPQANWIPLLQRFGTIIACTLVLLIAIQRHIRKNLIPEKSRLQQTLDQLKD